MRFERMTYRLEGGCSIQLSYQGLTVCIFRISYQRVFASFIFYYSNLSTKVCILSLKVYLDNHARQAMMSVPLIKLSIVFAKDMQTNIAGISTWMVRSGRPGEIFVK